MSINCCCRLPVGAFGNGLPVGRGSRGPVFCTHTVKGFELVGGGAGERVIGEAVVEQIEVVDRPFGDSS